ncbi:MAG: hypothetical protein KAY37_01160 [Phycisphaerae bacterium]|nr:hypothetical protein [Phycisphaerae bacterium]
MNSGLWSWCARGLAWWLKRNPLYLMSAACMAVGARLYLVSPGSYAGDIGLILLTLGVLQAYKWAVAGILLLLYRSRRSPEDEHSLLLVAALFWTGPLAATVELSARQAHLGLLFALGVLLFALLELFLVPRSLSLRMSIPGRVLAGACLVLLVVAPTQLHVSNAAGTNELFLYFCWWLLAGLALLIIGCVRAHLPALSRSSTPFGSRDFLREALFLLIVLAASAAHLYGMNYAFVGHARPFYAAPLLLALSVAAFDYLARSGNNRLSLRAVVAGVPLIAVGLATQPFEAEVPSHLLPVGLHDPLFTTLALSSLVWWFGALRHRSAGLFHFGALALAGTVYRGISIWLPADEASLAAAIPMRVVGLSALFTLVAYLCVIAVIRRSRGEAVLGLAVLQAAIVGEVGWKTPAALLIIGFVACWSLLIVLHLGVRRPNLSAVLWPIAIMLALAWYYDFDDALKWPARLNTVTLIVILLLAGQLWHATRYRTMAIVIVIANAIFLGGRGLAGGSYPIATLVVTGSFLLLIAGAGISWNKRALLHLTRVSEQPSTASNAKQTSERP